MIALSSTAQLLERLATARDISLTAYTLPTGRVLDALEDAARRGAAVRVRLEGYIYKDSDGVSAANARAVRALHEAGADARLVHERETARDPMLHAKLACVDGELFLDDRNWPDDGEDTIVRASGDARVAFTKRAALTQEARVLEQARRGDEVIVETESYGAGYRVNRALDAAARAGARVRLLVNTRDLHGNARERAALRKLEADGVSVRSCDSDEKFVSVNGAAGWVGSANATAAFDHPDQRDWGAATNAPDVLAHVRDAFERRWLTARAVA
jgi:phosphatidylserine/phosphatidylglycerophosphate/cardiolipin synthase-like enzyme